MRRRPFRNPVRTVPSPVPGLPAYLIVTVLLLLFPSTATWLASFVQ